MTALCLGLVVFFAVVDTPANAQVIYGTIVAEPEVLQLCEQAQRTARAALEKGSECASRRRFHVPSETKERAHQFARMLLGDQYSGISCNEMVRRVLSKGFKNKDPRLLLVAVNNNVIRVNDFSSTPISDGDEITIVVGTIAGG